MLVLIIVALAIIAVIWFARKNHYAFIPTFDEACHGHCAMDRKGLVENAWDCCECESTVDQTHEPGFYHCMCNLGYGDYCFTPRTNLLLSQ